MKESPDSNNKKKRLMSDDDIKNKLVEIFRYFNDVCRKHDIKYSLDGGSLIGAIRHKGIIPWDDDIDVGLNRKEYLKLVEAIKKEPNENFKLLLPGNQGYPYPFAKLVAADTAVEEVGFKRIPDYGVFLDIFVYHNLPNNPIRRIVFWQHIRFLKNGIWAQRKNGPFSSFYGQAKVAYLISRIFHINCVKSYIKKYEKLPDKPTKKMCHNWPGYSRKKEFQNSKNFNEYIDVEFEGIKAMAIKNYDSVLKRMYGNYMELPPKEKRVSNHNFKAYYKSKGE
ncbi:MAG: LicD family protein [Candidatus Saccharibacteria bacterium]|nr:LicD family protein [Candidatus Saccharibacteria bacterium]